MVPSSSYHIQPSKFSPESPPLPQATRSFFRPASRTNSQTSFLRERDLEAAQAAATPTPRIKDRLTKLFFDLRALRRDPEVVPLQPAYMATRPLYLSEKGKGREHEEAPPHSAAGDWRSRMWRIVLVIVILILLVNVVFLDVRLTTVSSSNTPSTPATSAPASTAPTLSAAAQQCITQFTVAAPSNPSSYPSASCLPILEAVLPGATANASDVQNAIQFSALKALFDAADSDAQTCMTGWGWLKDTRFCAWGKVNCDDTGLVSSITLTAPGVPTSIPSEIGGLSGLRGLQIVGTNTLPGGALPPSFHNLTALTALHLESTGITALPDGLFAALKNVTQLTLVNNAQMGGSLPSSATGLALQDLIINKQSLTTPLSTLLGSPTLQASLQILDLSSTTLNAALPGTIASFGALTELHLGTTALQPPLPATFPPSLHILDLSNNTALADGAVPSALCAANLTTCDLLTTGLSAPDGCGACQVS